MNETTGMHADGHASPKEVTPRHVKTGIVWLAGISIFRDSLQFGLTLLLVRLLSPRVYGEFSLANSFLSLFTVISLRSFLEHTIQVRPHEKVDYQTHFTWGAITQSVAIVGMVSVALILRRFPQYAAASVPIAVMSLFFLLDWPGELRVKMLERQLNWARLRLLEGVGVLASAAAAVILALAGKGVYALLVPLMLAVLPFSIDLFTTAGFRPNWTFNWSSYRAAFHYGLTRIASGAVARSREILESTAIVGVVGLATFGVYGRAAGLASFACLKLTSLLTLTIFPVLTRIDPATGRFRRASALVLRAIAWTAIPVAALFALIPGETIHILYGNKWSAVAPLFPWTLAVAALTAITEAAAFLLLANLQPKKTLAIDVLVLAGTAFSLVLLLPRGLIFYLGGMVFCQTVVGCAALVWLIRAGALPSRAILSALVPPFAISGILTACAVPITGRLHGWPRAAIFAVGFLTTYLISLRTVAPRDLEELLEWMPASRLVRRAFFFRRSY